MSQVLGYALASAVLSASTLCAAAVSLTVSAKGGQTQTVPARGAQAQTARKTVGYDDSPLGILAGRLFPAEKLYHVEGFFAPVVKRYQPVFDSFVAEYAASQNKLSIVAKYLPDADRALAAARRMKIPAKYEKEKAEYIRLFQTLITSAKVAVKLGGAKPPPPPPPQAPPRRREKR